MGGLDGGNSLAVSTTLDSKYGFYVLLLIPGIDHDFIIVRQYELGCDRCDVCITLCRHISS